MIIRDVENILVFTMASKRDIEMVWTPATDLSAVNSYNASALCSLDFNYDGLVMLCSVAIFMKIRVPYTYSNKNVNCKVKLVFHV